MTIALTYTLHLLEPVLATSLQGDPNSATTYPYIPGSLIRGAIIGRYLSQSGRSDQDFAADVKTRSLFLDGTTRYLNAYLLFDDKYRTLPTALSWYKDKRDQNEPFYLVDKADPEFDPEDFNERFDQPKQVEAQFCHLIDDTLILCKPETQISIHTQRERRAGRATQNDGAVFRYEALAPDQKFQGIILFDDETLVTELEPLLTGRLTIGGSRSGGYGLVEIQTVQQLPIWFETDRAGANLQPATPFTLTLLSDLIVRDENGQYNDSLNQPLLAAALGIDVIGLRIEKSFKRTALVGGFNRKWGLPLPQTLAIQAGSVFCCTTEVEITAQAINRLLQQGIGERRAEGFGRVAIDWPAAADLTVEVYQAKTTPMQRPALSGSQSLAHQMSERLLRRDADQALNKAINEIEIPPTGRPKKSQLGGLRVIIRQALIEQDPDYLVQHLHEIKPTARKQFERGRVVRGGNREALLAWLEQNAKEPERIWANINFKPDGARYIGRPIASDNNLNIEYTLRLLDGVLAKAAKTEGDE